MLEKLKEIIADQLNVDADSITVYWKSRKRHAWCIFKKNLTK